MQLRIGLPSVLTLHIKLWRVKGSASLTVSVWLFKLGFTFTVTAID